MFILKSTNGKIKGIKFDINNNIRLFLSDGDFIDIDMQNTEEDDFIKKIKEIDESISDDFLKKIYNFKHDRKEV
jgi:hypothetical protein